MSQNHYDMGIAVGDYDNDGFEDKAGRSESHEVPEG